MDTKNKQSVGQTHENGQSHGVAAVAAGSAKHRCVRIRPGLYNYRAYNIRRFSKGWAVLTEGGKPWHSPIDTLSSVCRMVDKIEDYASAPNGSDEPRGKQP